MNSTAVVFFVKDPRSEPVKTRLAADLISANESTNIYNSLLDITASTVWELENFHQVQTYFAVNSGWRPKNFHPKTKFVPQGEGNLGERLCQLHTKISNSFENVLFLGSDLPTLHTQIVLQAVQNLVNYETVIGPATDGGFYLFGTRSKLWINRWQTIKYSLPSTLSQIRILLGEDSCYFLRELTDVDDLKSLVCSVEEVSALPVLEVEHREFLRTAKNILEDAFKDHLGLRIPANELRP